MWVVLQHQMNVAIPLSYVSCLMQCHVCGNNNSSKHSQNRNVNIVYSIFLNLIVSECGPRLVLTLAYHEMCSVLLIKALCFLFADSCVFCHYFFLKKTLVS